MAFFQLLQSVGRMALLALVLAAPRLSAHPISLITLEALVHRDKMEVKIAVMPEDFLLVYGLAANGQSRLATPDIVKCAEKHKRFLLDGLIARDSEGNRLAGKVTRVELPPLPGDGLPRNRFNGDDHRVSSRICPAKAANSFELSTEFWRRRHDDPRRCHLVVTREGLPPEPSVCIPGEENVATIAFNWNEVSRPMTGDYAETKAREEEKRKEGMGFTSYSATYTFVYIQNEEVRVEILMPLLTLEMWQPVARTNADFLEVPEQRAARGALEAFFTKQNEMEIDGVWVKPRLDRLDFYGIDFKDFAMRAEPRRLSAWTARVGAILIYSTKGAPGHIDLKWTLFNQEMLAARAVSGGGSGASPEQLNSG